MVVVRNTQICKGAPTISGRRIMVSDIVYRVMVDGARTTQEDLNLSSNQITEALTYCSKLKCIQPSEDLPFCNNCSLRELSPQSLKDIEMDESRGLQRVQSEGKEDPFSSNSDKWLIAFELLNRPDKA